MIIAKRKNVEFPSKIAIENCLKYNKKMNAVINKDGLNYIFRNINNYNDFTKILFNYDIKISDSFVIKTYTCYNSDNEKNQPLVITDDYKEMVEDEIFTTKSVITFHKEPSGINNIDKGITKEMFFTKMLYNYDYMLYSELFNLAIGDNKAVIIDADGNIDEFCCNKTKNWEEDKGILYSDDDYKYGSSTTYYRGGYENDWNDEYDQSYYYSKYCTKCHEYSASVTYFDNKPYCKKCFDLVSKKFVCYTCSKELNYSQMSDTNGLCKICSSHINSVR